MNFPPRLRQVPESLPKRIFLTFDDGPAGDDTRAVIDLLAQVQAKATFFFIANKAQQNSALVKTVVNSGHAIGNHSSDHRYHHFFRGQAHLKSWIMKAQDQLAQISGVATVGFRPPAGVITPELLRALTDLQLPLWLWRHRFFDSLFAWKESAAKKTLARLQTGDILLLHDKQKPRNRQEFRQTLQRFLTASSALGWESQALPTVVKKGFA